MCKLKFNEWLSIVDYCGLDLERIVGLSWYVEQVTGSPFIIARLEWWIDIEEEWNAQGKRYF